MDALGERERAAFEACAVFASPFDARAVAAVAGVVARPTLAPLDDDPLLWFNPQVLERMTSVNILGVAHGVMASLPSALTIQTSIHGPMSPVVRQSAASETEQSSRADANTIVDPSGDHAGQPSSPGASVSWLMFDPSASITKML